MPKYTDKKFHELKELLESIDFFTLVADFSFKQILSYGMVIYLFSWLFSACIWLTYAVLTREYNCSRDWDNMQLCYNCPIINSIEQGLLKNFSLIEINNVLFNNQDYINDTRNFPIPLEHFNYDYTCLRDNVGIKKKKFGFNVDEYQISNFGHKPENYSQYRFDKMMPVSCFDDICLNNIKSFFDAFIFSLENQYTVGYGTRYRGEVKNCF